MNHLVPLLMIMVFMPIISLACTPTHFLMCLLNLEMLTLTTIMLMTLLMMTYSSWDTLSLMMILSFSACEASLGLALLVTIMRSHGNDNIKSMHFTKC